jgi:iron-sulfur cluster insertion protein
MINMTENAKLKIDQLCEENNAYALTLAVVGAGCSGLKYEWGLIEFESDLSEDEEVFETSNGGKLAIESVSLAYIADSTIDYVSDLMGSNFDIINPNSKSSCGCGV